MENRKKIVIVGATSAIAEHCARIWLRDEAVDITLLGRHMERVERVAADLRVRNPQSVIHTLVTDFTDPARILAVVDQIASESPPEIVLIAHGYLPEQARCQNDLEECRSALEINGISPVLFAEAFATRLARANRGTLALISSVAGDRGRKSNYVYGAAKGLVSRYAQGLQHRFAGSGVKVVLIKPGPTDTPMTSHLKSQVKNLAPVEEVSAAIVNAIAKGQRVIYVPSKWCLIMWIIKHLPATVFNRLNV